MGLFSPKKKSDCLLLVDIGSGSVAGAIMLASPAQPPRVLYTFRSDIPFQVAATGTRLLSLMLHSLSQVMLALAREGFDAAGFGATRPLVREAIVSLSAPFVISKASFLSLRNEEPVHMTPEVLETLLQHSDKDASESRFAPEGSVLIERKLMQSLLNGYETAFPYNKTVADARFAVFDSFSLSSVTDSVRDAIEHHLYVPHVSFHSFMLLMFAALRESHAGEEHFLAVDVSGEQTELAVVRQGTLVECITFPFGKNRLMRMIHRETSAPVAGVAALLSLNRAGGGAGEFVSRGGELLMAAENEWLAEFANTLSSFSEEPLLPRTVFVTADEDVSSLICGALARGGWSGGALAPPSFQVIPVTQALIEPFLSWSPSLAPDPFIGLIAVAGNRLRHPL